MLTIFADQGGMSDSFSFWCDGSRVRWAFAAAFLALVGAALVAAGLWVTVPAVPQTAFATATLAGVAGNYRRGARSPRLSVVAEGLLLLVVIFAAGILLSYAAATIGLPYRDAAFDAADRALGFNWQAYAAFVDSSPPLATAYRLAYASLIPQLFILTVALAAAGRFERLHRFLIAVVIALTVTCTAFALMPAVSVYAYLQVPIDSFTNIHPISTFQHVGPIAGLRAGEITSISFADVHGLITFPSFHACGAALLAWGFWSIRVLRWPFLILNLLMIGATPIDGAHYFVDVIAGLALAGLAVLIANRLSRVPESASARVAIAG
ncbi:MAG: phosphatase PAP2 family protein [Sphingomonas sp.]